MTDFTLTILLESPAAVGSGGGRAGVVDREVVHDDLGLPLIPARRLKGLLREAALEVNETLRAFPSWRSANLLTPDELFGASGGSAPGPLELRDALLPEYEALRAWIRRGVDAKNGGAYFNPEAVLAAFTEERDQTALDRRTGGPKTNSLRRTRVLRRTLEFFAEGSLHPGPDVVKALRTLDLACRGLRRMGLSRNRGLGRVTVSLTVKNFAYTALGEEALAAALTPAATTNHRPEVANA